MQMWHNTNRAIFNFNHLLDFDYEVQTFQFFDSDIKNYNYSQNV
jgi:hypothetical protein